MFHGFRILLLIMPPYSFITLGIILVICIISMLLSLRINRLRVTQLYNKQQSLLVTVVAILVISEIAMVITTVLMVVLTNVIVSPLSRVHSEWGLVAAQDYLNLLYYYAIYGFIYANLQFLSGFVFRKPLGNQFPSFFGIFLLFNTGIWVVGNLILGLLRIPH